MFAVLLVKPVNATLKGHFYQIPIPVTVSQTKQVASMKLELKAVLVSINVSFVSCS